MKTSKMLLFSILIFSICFSMTPASASGIVSVSEYETLNGAKGEVSIPKLFSTGLPDPVPDSLRSKYASIDPGMLLYRNLAIDPGILLPEFPNIDPGMLMNQEK